MKQEIIEEILDDMAYRLLKQYDAHQGRRTPLRGAAHPQTKVVPEDRAIIREMRERGFLLREIASCFGISFQIVSAICLRRSNYAAE